MLDYRAIVLRAINKILYTTISCTCVRLTPASSTIEGAPQPSLARRPEQKYIF